MKQAFRRLLAGSLAALLLTGSALASAALGDDLHQFTVPLADGASLTTQMFWSNSRSDLRTENYITYKPDSSLSPQVSYGASVLSKRNVANMAADIEATGKRVLSGINGDYFVMASGDPLGIVMTGGILRSSASYLDGIGFLPDGSAIIGKPNLTVTAKFDGYALKVAEVNKIRTATGYYLMSSDFGATTQNTKAGIDVILAPVRDNLGQSVTAENGQTLTTTDVLKIGGRVDCVVEQVIDASGATAIPPGKFVMTINKSGGQFLVDALAAVQVGSTMSFEITSPDTRWNNVDSAIGAMYRILTDGVVNTGLDDAAAPRTAVGVKPDGTVLFYTIDGRRSAHSVGASMTQVANRLLELGCVNAVCLDGGGSTTLGVSDPGSNGFEVVNKPSENSLRSVTNALFLVSNLYATGSPARLFVEPSNRILLSGGSTKITSSLVDSSWYPMQGSEAMTYTAQKGSVSADGTYTAPTAAGTDTITVTSASGLSGSTTVTVFQSPTSVNLTNETTGTALSALNLSSGESVNLHATANYRLIPLASADTSYTWSVSPASIGTITPEGVFTAASINGSGSIEVTAGTHKASLPVTISTNIKQHLLADFEGTSQPLQAGIGIADLDFETRSDYLRYGKKSLRVDYVPSGGEALLPANLPLTADDQYLHLWVYGDKSGNVISANVRDSAGSTHKLGLGTLDFSGLKRLYVALPQGSSSFMGLSLSGTKDSTIWLDQILGSNSNLEDTSAPSVTLSVVGSAVTATISDNGLALPKEQMHLQLDGVAQPFTLDGMQLSANITLNDSALHRVSLTVSDLSGNVKRVSSDLGDANSYDAGFVDMSTHWAKPQTSYLAARGIVKGETGKNGLIFRPDQSITRGDFALMCARWYGLDLSATADLELPFSDVGSIPAWSLDAVKAMYSQGLMKGSTEGNKTYAKAGAAITRAEAMTILGRMQPKGYAEASLADFSDAASIPAWAKSHLSALISQGVVGGSNGLLRPLDSVSRAELSKMLFTMW